MINKFRTNSENISILFYKKSNFGDQISCFRKGKPNLVFFQKTGIRSVALVRSTKLIVGFNQPTEINQFKKLLILGYLKTKKKNSTLSENIGLIGHQKAFKLQSSVLQKYAMIRIFIGFSNINFSLLTLEGKIVSWLNGGSSGDIHSKRTRMTGRYLTELMVKFLTNFLKLKNKFTFFKVLFVGPSKRFRSKLFSTIKRKFKRLRYRIICKEEGFHRTFNGCRLSRKKR